MRLDASFVGGRQRSKTGTRKSAYQEQIRRAETTRVSAMTIDATICGALAYESGVFSAMAAKGWGWTRKSFGLFGKLIRQGLVLPAAETTNSSAQI